MYNIENFYAFTTVNADLFAYAEISSFFERLSEANREKKEANEGNIQLIIVYYIYIMLKLYLFLAALALISCEKKEPKNEKAVIEKAVDSYGALIEKAKGTEAVLQKKADSIIRQSDSLGIPR